MTEEVADPQVLEPTEAPLIEGVAIETPAVDTAVVETPADKPAKRPHDPVVGELTKERGRRRAAEEALAAAQKEAQAAKDLLARASRGEKVDGLPSPSQAAPYDDEEIARRVEYKLFLRDVAKVRETGSSAFGADAFNESIARLAAYGADTDDFVRDVMEVDLQNSHALLHTISQDAARAIGLANMTPKQRYAELKSMSIAEKTPKAAPKAEEPKAAPAKVSAAPRPAPAISASTNKNVDWRSDAASDEDFTRGFNEMLKKRSARR